MRRSRFAFVLLAPIALAILGCQALKDITNPTEPTPTASPSASPIAIPVVKPTPVPTPTPTPTPTPGPTPTPDPTPTPASACSLPASNPSSPVCTDDPTQLLPYMETALTNATEAKPSLFDFNDKICNTCYKVLDVDGYIKEVGRQLSALGVCSLYDGEEMAVKNSNSFSEQIDILTAANYIRRGSGSYRGVCKPALF